ncbi:hypothetical protein LTWDN19_03700 [Latilactobacillus curvatus]|uniref:Uncharacterized protein n=1 Tax=Latilactobacillus curvatus TaxID=28038 RepID=A0ABN6GG23_LATCU|nr:hypothetical protein LTWDN19_03700 [Latilactobacillus curvatus]
MKPIRKANKPNDLPEAEIVAGMGHYRLLASRIFTGWDGSDCVTVIHSSPRIGIRAIDGPDA